MTQIGETTFCRSQCAQRLTPSRIDMTALGQVPKLAHAPVSSGVEVTPDVGARRLTGSLWPRPNIR